MLFIDNKFTKTHALQWKHFWSSLHEHEKQTPCSSLLPKTVIQLVKKFPVFCRPESIITMFTEAWTR